MDESSVFRIVSTHCWALCPALYDSFRAFSPSRLFALGILTSWLPPPLYLSLYLTVFLLSNNLDTSLISSKEAGLRRSLSIGVILPASVMIWVLSHLSNALSIGTSPLHMPIQMPSSALIDRTSCLDRLWDQINMLLYIGLYHH